MLQQSHVLRETFKYTHKNPYHEKLEDFKDFVLRDLEGESFQGKWNSEVFKRQAPLIVEIGSGYGHFMLEYCQANPDINYIGIDYRFKRSFQLAKRLQEIETQNFRYLRAKGERLSFLFGQDEIDKLYYFFPDPWPKTKHNKKRLFQTNFLQQAQQVLKPGGKLLIKTDHDGYALWMSRILEQQDLFDITFETKDLYVQAPQHFLASFQTKFEKIFLKQEIKIKAFELKVKK